MTELATVTSLPELEEAAAKIAQRVPLIVIRDAESFTLAVEDRAEIKRRLARIEEVIGPICAATHAAWKTATTKREALRGPFLEADKAYSRAMGAWEQEQERLRREAEQKAQRERERLEAEERARVQAEQRRLQEEADQRRLDEALAAEQRGDKETATRLIEAPVEAPIVLARPVFVPVAPIAPKPLAAGVSFRDNWTAEVTDLAALVKAVAEHRAELTLLMPNMVALNGMARSLKDALKIPGVRAKNERIAAQKA
jgi:hypothetical protein